MNMNTTDLFAMKDTTIFDRFADSIELSSHCLKVVLSIKKKEKSLSAGYSVPLTSGETELMDHCLRHLNAFNQTILHQLISQYRNKSSDSDLGEPSVDYKQEFPSFNGWYAISFWSTIFVVMEFLSIFANLLIIWIILRRKVIRSVINIFLFNRTLSDLLTVTMNATVNFLFMLTGDWPFNYVYCVFNNFMNNLTIASSVFTETVMSIDRYSAIVRDKGMTKKRALLSIGLIWLCSALFASPTIIYSQTVTIPYKEDNKRTLCLLEWPDGLPIESKFEFAYNIAFFFLIYIIPIIIMTITYTLMTRILRDREQNLLRANVQADLIRMNRKCIRMLITVFIVFGICWLPYHSYFLSTYIWPEIIKFKPIKHIYLAIYWLAMANSLFNPIILYIMNERFRISICYYIGCRCFTELPFQFERQEHVHSTRLNTIRVEREQEQNNICLQDIGQQSNSIPMRHNEIDVEVK